jgi:hypothetical protein
MNQEVYAQDYDFELLADIMTQLDCIVSAAEYHGLVCGRVIGNPSIGVRDCRHQTLEFLGLPPEQGDSQDLLRLLSLPEWVAAQLRHEDYSFQPLLPADDIELQLRARELGRWCDGFLTGLALAGQDQQCWAALPPELADGLTDLASIAQIGATDNDSESDFTELFEYVRLVVLTAHAEMALATKKDDVPRHSASGLFQGEHKLH